MSQRALRYTVTDGQHTANWMKREMTTLQFFISIHLRKSMKSIQTELKVLGNTRKIILGNYREQRSPSLRGISQKLFCGQQRRGKCVLVLRWFSADIVHIAWTSSVPYVSNTIIQHLGGYPSRKFSIWWTGNSSRYYLYKKLMHIIVF